MAAPAAAWPSWLQAAPLQPLPSESWLQPPLLKMLLASEPEVSSAARRRNFCRPSAGRPFPYVAVPCLALSLCGSRCHFPLPPWASSAAETPADAHPLAAPLAASAWPGRPTDGQAAAPASPRGAPVAAPAAAWVPTLMQKIVGCRQAGRRGSACRPEPLCRRVVRASSAMEGRCCRHWGGYRGANPVRAGRPGGGESRRRAGGRGKGSIVATHHCSHKSQESCRDVGVIRGPSPEGGSEGRVPGVTTEHCAQVRDCKRRPAGLRHMLEALVESFLDRAAGAGGLRPGARSGARSGAGPFSERPGQNSGPVLEAATKFRRVNVYGLQRAAAGAGSQGQGHS